MTEQSTVEIAKNVIQILEADPVLSSYVSSFAVGGIDIARKRFPFVAVEAPERNSEPLSIGRDGYMNNVYAIRVYGGTYHTLPEVAHAGNGEGKKGIVQLNSDLLNVLIPNTFDGTFPRPVRLISSSTAHRASSGGRSWITMITLSGRLSTRK